MPSLRRWLIKPLLYVVALAVTVLVTIVLVYAVQARVRLPELHAWHRIVLREEAGSGRPAAFDSFEAYRRQEERLFAELRERIYAGRETDTFALGRYNPQSVVATLALDTPYNRSYELAPAGEPRGSVLLMHGLTDSPYSMRGIAEVFQSRGYYVVALRLPGHGTLPGGVARSAAGRIGMRQSPAPRSTRRRAAEAASLFTSAATRPAPRWRRSMRCARSTTPSCRSRKESISSPPRSASRRSRCSRT